MDREDIITEELAHDAAADRVLDPSDVADDPTAEEAAFADDHLEAAYEVYDEYMDYEPSPYDGTYSEM